MRLNKSTHDAIKILSICGEANGSLLKVADISRRLGITQQNVFKIVHILTHAELLSAVRGRNGGVRLARPAVEISVGDIVRAMEETRIDPDQLRASSGRAAVDGVLDSALGAFVAVLDRHSLASMAVSSTGASTAGATPGEMLTGGARPRYARKPASLSAD